MTVTGLGTSRKSVRFPVLPLLSAGMLLAALIGFTIELARFAQRRDVIQVDVTVAGVSVTGLKSSEAVTAWERVYDQPIELNFQGSRILLNPSKDIGFRTNSDLMLADVNSKLSGANSYWVDFWNYLWRKPITPISAALVAEYQEAKLRNFLQDIAARYEQPASGAAFDVNTMTFGSGASGMRLDVEASMQAVDAALRRPTNRVVKLVMKSEGARAANMDTLKQAILEYLTAKGWLPDGKNTLASVVVTDLQSGQELSINPDVAYSSASTVKIPIMLNIFRKLDFAPEVNTKWLMGASIICSNNSASNYLMQLSGSGTNAHDQLVDGLGKVNSTARELGAKNTFITAPLYVLDKTLQWSIPAPKTSPDPRFDAQPDPYNQTTAQDMAVLLHELYDCSEYGSGLIAAFPDNYSQHECKQMVELLSGNVIGRMIELGVPQGTRVAHKNGWGKVNSGYNSSDAAIVFTPGGNYVLSIYMWERLKPGQEIGSIAAWEAIEGVSRVVYNFFNADQPMLATRTPENPYTAVECVMPNPKHPEILNLDDIKTGRFDADGNVLPDACYNYQGTCDPIPQNKLSGSASAKSQAQAPAQVPATTAPTIQDTQPTLPAPPTAVPAQPTKPTDLPTAALSSTLPPPPPK